MLKVIFFLLYFHCFFHCHIFAYDRTSFITIRHIISSMKIKIKVPKIYVLVSAVVVILTVSILGSQQLMHQVIAQGQVNNTSSPTPSGSNNTAPSSSSISMQLSQGYVNGKTAYFIATDASDNHTAASITNSTGFKVN